MSCVLRTIIDEQRVAAGGQIRAERRTRVVHEAEELAESGQRGGAHPVHEVLVLEAVLRVVGGGDVVRVVPVDEARRALPVGRLRPLRGVEGHRGVHVLGALVRRPRDALLVELHALTQRIHFRQRLGQRAVRVVVEAEAISEQAVRERAARRVAHTRLARGVLRRAGITERIAVLVQIGRVGDAARELVVVACANVAPVVLVEIREPVVDVHRLLHTQKY